MSNSKDNTKEITGGAINLSSPITKILAIGSLTEKGLVEKDRLAVMPFEVTATVGLHLEGIIEQWWIKPDISGPVFIMNVQSVEKAHDLLEALPLGVAEMMTFQLIPLGPLSPLRFLLNKPETV